MTRALYKDKIVELEELREDSTITMLQLVVDRISANTDEESVSRYGDSVQTAFQIGHGQCCIWNPETKKDVDFSTRFELDGITFEEPSRSETGFFTRSAMVLE